MTDTVTSPWDPILRANTLLYPETNVLRWLAGASKRVPAGANALDVGFGSGHHLRLFIDHGFRAHGTEFLDYAIELGHGAMGESPLAGKLTKGALDHPDLQDSSFHLIIAWGVICLMPPSDIERALADMYRIAAPGAEICLNFRTPDNWFYGLGEELEPGFFKLDERAEEYRDCLYSFYTAEDCSSLCRDAGFEIVNVERAELWKNNMAKRHSWFVMWLRKPEASI